MTEPESWARLRAAGWRLDSFYDEYDGSIFVGWVGPDGKPDNAEWVGIVHGGQMRAEYENIQRRAEKNARQAELDRLVKIALEKEMAARRAEDARIEFWIGMAILGIILPALIIMIGYLR